MSPFRRKLQSKLAEFTGLGLDRDSAVTFLNDTVTDAQPKAHALADVFGSVKGIENFVEVLGADAGAIIADDEDALAVLDAAYDGNGCLLVFKFLGLERVHRVLEQVDKDLDEFALVGPNGLMLGKTLFHLNHILPFVAQETQGRSNDFRDLDLIAAFGVRMGEGA